MFAVAPVVTSGTKIALPGGVPSTTTTTGTPDMINSMVEYNVLEIVNRGLAYAIIIAGFLSLVFIFIGGISFILSGGEEAKIKSAVSTIRYSIIGLIVTILATVIIGVVGKAMGLNIIQYINLKDIFSTISSITSSQTTGGGQSSGTVPSLN